MDATFSHDTGVLGLLRVVMGKQLLAEIEDW